METGITKADRNDLTTGGIGKKLVIFFLPIALGTIFQQLYNAVDGIIVGKFVGTQALAAVGGSAAAVSMAIINMLIALASGGSVIVAQFFGAGDRESVSKSVHTALSFSGICGLGVAVAGYLLSPSIIVWMKTTPDTAEAATTYLRIICIGAVFTLVYNMGASILRAVGDSRRPFLYLVISCVLNIALDLLFVIRFGMGVAGVAIATVISQAVTTVLVFVQLCRSKEVYRVTLKKLGIEKAFLNRILGIGGPACAQQILFSITQLWIQMAVNSLGTVVVASWALSGKIDGIYWGIVTAAGIAIRNFVGQNYGAHRFDRIRRSVRVSALMFTLMTVAISSAILLLARTILPVFTDDPAAVETTWKLICYFVPYYFTWTILEIHSGALQGMGDVNMPVLFTALGICVFRILWINTVFRFHHTLFVLSMCYPLSWAITAACVVIYYYFGPNRLRRETMRQ